MTDSTVEGGWGTDESSGFMRHFVGTVTGPYFGTNPKIGEGRTLLLHWPVKVEEVFDESYEDKVGEEETILFSCGKDWETPDGGETAVHGSGNANKLFHASSAMGMLIDGVLGKVANYGDNASLTSGDPLEVDITDAEGVLRERGAATDAATWDGLRWEFDEVMVDYGMDRSDPPQPIISKRALPVKFLGVADDKAAAKGKAEKPKPETAAQKKAREKREAKAAEKAAASSNGDSDSGSDPLAGIEISDDLRAKLTQMAAGAEDASTFQDAAFEDDEVLENDDLLTVVSDDEQLAGVYEALRA